MSNQHYSPLRYPGGKVSLYDFLKAIISKNGIIDGTYAEAFAGGAGAALKLLMHEEVNNIYLNDKDEFIYKFWYSVLHDTDGLLKLIKDIKPTLAEWYRRKEILRHKTLQANLSTTEIGFTAFFLNRVNRSGILKAGVIGGSTQQGNWKIDARYNKNDLIERISKISLYKERIHLFNDDAIIFLKNLKLLNLKQDELLVYLDPPYVGQGKDLYRYFFTDYQHRELAVFLQKKFKANWVTSYDDHPLIHSYYKEVTKNILEFNYYVNRTKVGKELIITSKNCLLPLFDLNNSQNQFAEQSNGQLKKIV